MKISQSILLCFSIILVLFSVTTVINHRQATLILDNVGQLDRTNIITRQSNRFQRNFLTMVSGLRGYLITGDSSFIKIYDSARIDNDEILDDLKMLMVDNADQRTVLDDIHELQHYWKDEFALPLLHAKNQAILSPGDHSTFRARYREKLVNELEEDVQLSIQHKFADLTLHEYPTRANNRKELLAQVHNTEYLSLGLTVLSLVIGGGIAIFIARHLSERLKKMAGMAHEIAGGNYTIRLPEKGSSEVSRLGLALNNMAETLEAKTAILNRRNEDLEQFAYTISHELKAPLRGINNVATWIAEDGLTDLSAETQQYLRLIKAKVGRAETILKAIFVYTRSGREALSKEVVDVGQLLGEIRDDVMYDKTIALSVQPDMPVLFTERIPLLQIFTNLIVNAFKYHDNPRGSIKVSWASHGDYYTFAVEDDGPGINPRHHDRIFTAFETLHGDDTSDSTGIGLAIVKKILDDRNLSIHIASEPGKGSTFTFIWPKNET